MRPQALLHIRRKVLWIIIALKNPSPRPSLNPRPLDPVASTLITTPPRRLQAHTNRLLLRADETKPLLPSLRQDIHSKGVVTARRDRRKTKVVSDASRYSHEESATVPLFSDATDEMKREM
jgi:hypothetical protein